MELVDSPLHKGLRQKMISKLQDAGISQTDVLQAMAAVPRHFFKDSGLAEHSYQLCALPLFDGQTISHPLTVARQTQLLQPKFDDKILEIGTGSGYQAAILCAMGVQQVFSIERHRSLYEFAKNILGQIGYQPTLIFGDGFEGLPQYAPFNKIIVTCGAEDIPQKLQAQLAIGGRMIIPVKQGGSHYLFAIDRESQTEFNITNCGPCRDFVPMLKETK